MTELEKKVRSKILKTVLSRSDKTYAKQALDYINELEKQLNLHDVGKCVLCKNKTEKLTINYCDECLENYNGIE